jgi:PAS domain S-box-containing protein
VLKGKELVATVYASYEGKKRLVGFTPIPSIGWAATAGRTEDLAMASITASLLPQTILFLVVSMVVFGVALVLSRKISSPVARLRNQALALGRGEIETPVIASGPTELKELADSFNTMAHELRSREASLREQREWLRVTLSSIGDAVIATDATGGITFINPIAAELTGWRQDEAEGATIREVFRIINEQTREPAEDIVGRILRDGKVALLANHTALISRDGREIPIEDSAAPIRNDAGKILGVVLVFHDVTEKRKARQELSEVNRRLTVIVDSIADGFYALNAELRFTHINDAALRYFKKTREEMIGNSIYDLFPRFKGSAFETAYRRAMSTGEPGRLETPSVTTDRTVEIHAYPGLDNMTVLFRDVTERKQMEEALHELSQRLSYHVENSPLAVIEWGPDMRLIRWSGEAERIFGWRAEEVIGKRMEDFRWIYEEDDAQVAEVSSELKSGADPQRFSANRNYRKDGSVIDCEWYNSSLLDDSGALRSILSLVLDVTERKRLEEELRESEERFRLLSETAGKLLATEDPRGIVNELCREVMKNLDCQAFFNFLVDEQAGRLHLNACAGIPEEEIRKIEWLDYGVAVCGCVAREGARIVAEDIFNTSDLRTELVKSYGIQAYCCHPLTAQGRLIGTLSFGARKRTRFSPEDLALMKTVADQVAIAVERIKLIRELQRSRDDLELRVYERTEELQAANEILRHQEEEISKARLMLQIVFDGISDSLFMVDKDLGVMMLNRASLRYFQVNSIDEAVGKTCSQLIGKKCASCHRCEISLAISEGRNVTFERKGLFDPERVEQITIYPVDEAGSWFSGAIIRISDITESKNMERHLIRADRLSSLGQLSGGIAHEIRNPLQGINLFVDALSNEEKFCRTSEELNILDEIKGSIKRIDAIIRRVLDFSRQRETTALSNMKVSVLIGDSLKLWQMRIVRDRIEFKLFLEENVPEVPGDSIEIQQVLTNLIQNAVEAIGKEGTLSISAIKGTLSFDDKRPAVIIRVHDSGPGIPIDQQKNIFNPFFTTKYNGTGLGLAISHQIVARHGGLISFESAADDGTTFTVELPAAPGS